MNKYKVIQITIYQCNNEVQYDNRSFNGTIEKDIITLTELLGAFISKDQIATVYNKRLITALEEGDYKSFYKIVKKIAKKCIKQIEKSELNYETRLNQ